MHTIYFLIFISLFPVTARVCKCTERPPQQSIAAISEYTAFFEQPDAAAMLMPLVNSRIPPTIPAIAALLLGSTFIKASVTTEKNIIHPPIISIDFTADDMEEYILFSLFEIRETHCI